MSRLLLAVRFASLLIVVALIPVAIQAQTPADSLTITFRAFQPSSPNMFVPGAFNGWGPNASGVITAGAVSQMTYNGTLAAWIKTYVFKIHNSGDANRTLGDSVYQYKLNQGGTSTGWYSDPLNPEKNAADNNNSVLRLTKAFWFEVNLIEASSQISKISAGLPYQNSVSISSIVLSYGQTEATATTVNVTGSLNASTRLFDYTLPSAIPKSYFIRLVAYTSAGDSALYYNPGLNIVTMAVPGYANQGVTLPSVASNDSTTFVVRAPGRDYVKIRIAPIGQSPSAATGVLLRKGTDSYTWWMNMSLAPGTYEYLYEMPDGTLLYDPWGMYNGTAGSRFTVGPAGLTADDYTWQNTGFVRPPLNKLVIYELNLNEVVGGYTGKTPGNCKFSDLTALLPYYDSLGINCIELMPINDYGLVGPSGFSWGYDLNTDFALEPSFGTPADFKALVDAAHGRGISIIVDVVYNHLNDTGPLWQISPSLATNPYFHTAGTNYNEDGTSLFKDMNHWTNETQQYIYGALKMWLDRYKVDGFRFDFTRGIGWHDTEPTKGILGWANRIDTEYNHQVYLIAEHLPESPTLIHISGLTGGWHDGFHDELFNEAATRATSLDNFENYILDLHAYSAADVPATYTSYDDRTGPVNMAVDHDEQSLIYEMTQFHGISSAEAVKRDRLYGTFMFTSLGIPLLWEGMEHAEPRGWPDGNSKLNYRPVQWTLGNAATGQSHFQFYKNLINLRKNNPALNQGNLHRMWKYYTQKCLVWGFDDPSSSAKIMVVANLNNSDQTITNVPWLEAGTWYNVQDNSPFSAPGTSIASMVVPAYTAIVYSNQAPANPPIVNLLPNNLDFGDVAITATKSLGIGIQNTGGSTLSVSSVVSNNARFTVKTSTFTVGIGATVNDTLRYSPLAGGADSAYYVITSNATSFRDTVWVKGNCVLPVVTSPVLYSPADLSIDQPLISTVRWHKGGNAIRYELQLSIDSLFGSTIVDDTTITDTTYIHTYSENTTYFWRVKSVGTYSKSAFSTAFRFATTVQPFQVLSHLNAKWNLVSLPVDAADKRVSVLYPNAGSGAFAFEGGYHQKDTLNPGVGYWLKSDSARTITFTGSPITVESVQVVSGWNLIGSISFAIVPGSVTSSIPGMITGSFFAYNAGYVAADSLRSGSGYWVKVSADGWLYFVAPGASTVANTKPNTIRIVPTNELPPAPPGAEQDVPAILPSHFALGQNYPNPFNPSTTIRFTLARQEQVSLVVYDMLGKVVARLVDGTQQAGEHAVQWTADNVPSGTYYYRLTTPTESAMGRMVLLK